MTADFVVKMYEACSDNLRPDGVKHIVILPHQCTSQTCCNCGNRLTSKASRIPWLCILYVHMTYIWAACTSGLQLPRKLYAVWTKWTCVAFRLVNYDARILFCVLSMVWPIFCINKLPGVSSIHVCKRLFVIVLSSLFLNFCHVLATSVWSHFAYNLVSPRCLWDVIEWMLVIKKKFQSECNTSLCWGVYCKASCFFSFQEWVAVCFDTGSNLSEGKKW